MIADAPTLDASIAPPAPRASGKRLVLRAIQLGVAAMALTWLFTRIPLGDVASVIADVRMAPLLGALATVVASQFLVAHRLKRLTDAHDLGLTTAQVLGVNLSTLFYGLFVPAGNFVGFAVRFYRLSGAQRKVAAAAVALLLDRLAATATLCFVGAAFWFAERPAGTELVPVVMLGTLLAMTLVIAVLATPVRVPGIAIITNMLVKVKKLRSLRAALRDSRALPRHALVPLVMMSIAAHLLGMLGYWLVALALGLDLSFVSTGWLRSSMIFAALLPLSIAGLGVREGTAVALLSAYGIASEEALAFSLLAFAVTVLFPALLGGLVELRRWR